MLCPSCQNTMREREKGDVVIDICPACRGIWLEAGELEKLIESERRFYDRDDDDDDGDERRNRDDRDRPSRYRLDDERPRYRSDDERPRVEEYRSRGDAKTYPKKKSSFLSNVFESFGGGEGGD